MTHVNNKIHTTINQLRRRYRIAVVLRRAAGVNIVALVILIIDQLTFAVFPWTILPWVFDLIIIGWGIGIIAVSASAFTDRKISPLFIARMFESQVRIQHPWISLSLELAGETQGSALLKEDVHSRAEQICCQHLKKFIVPDSKKRLGFAGLLLCLLFVSTLIVTPSLHTFWKLPLTSIMPVRATITAFPSSIVPFKGKVSLRCLPAQSLFPSCQVSITDLEKRTSRQLLLTADAYGSFSATFDSCESSFIYQFVLGTRRLPPDTVHVVPRPYVTQFHVTLLPPAYTGQKKRELPTGQGNFAAFAGTKVSLGILAPFKLAQAVCVLMPSGKRIPLTVVENSAHGEFGFETEGTYTFSFIDSLGQSSDSLSVYVANLLEDMPPSVRIVSPGENRQLTTALRDSLTVQADDDFGIVSAAIGFFTTSNRDTFGTFLASPQSPVSMLRWLKDWNFSGLSLYPGDTVYYWAQVSDRAGKTQTARTVYSDTFWFRLPHFGEIHQQIAQQQSDAAENVESAQRSHEQVQEALSQIIKTADGKKELTWSQKQIAQDLSEKLKASADSLNAAVESLDKAIEKMQEEGSLDKDLVSTMDAVKTAMADLAKKYGDSLFFNKKSPQQVSSGDLKQALDKLSEALPDLKKQLESVLDYLRKLEKDQRLASLAAKAQQLADQQNQIAQESQKSPTSPQAAEQQAQKECVAGVEHLLDSIKKEDAAQQLLSPEDSANIAQIDSLNQQVSGSQKQSSQNGKQQSQKQLASKLNSLAQSLRDKRSSRAAEKMEQDRKRLLDLAGDMLSLSEWSDQLDAENTFANRQDREGEQAAQTEALKQSLAQRMPQFDSIMSLSPMSKMALKQRCEQAIASMTAPPGPNSSMDGIPERMLQGTPSQQSSGSPSTLLNSCAGALLAASKDLGQSQCPGGSSSGESPGSSAGLKQGLGRISQKQSALNSATASILQQLLAARQQAEQSGTPGDQGMAGPNGQKMSGEQRAEAQREAAAQQDEIARQLKELSDKYGKESGGSGGQAARMQELREEAMRLAHMIRQSDPDVVNRQEKLSSRMLETTLSMQEQDGQKDERKSTTATATYDLRRQAKQLSASRASDTYYKIRRQILDGNFPDEYSAAIRSYVDSLGVMYLKK